MNDLTNKPLLRMLFVIADWNQSVKINDVFKSSPAPFYYMCKAEGTASSDILDMFGLGRTDKMLALCVTPQPIAQTLLKKSGEVLLFKKKGTGIAFTVSVSGASSNVLKLLNKDTQEKLIDHISKIESEVENMKSETSLALIMSVINQGYSEDLMEAARSAGASGGTVIHSRRIGLDEHINFLGLSMQAEKEIVFILADRENKVEIMKSINQKCGLKSEAQGITISLPVDSAVGLEALKMTNKIQVGD